MIVWLFPGQGSPGGSLARLRASDDGLALLARASALLDRDLLEESVASQTHANDVVQRAMFLVEIDSARAMQNAGVPCDAVAGHSIGGFAAAVVAGAIAFEDALRIVDARGRSMTALAPFRYGMAAIVGCEEADVRAIVARCARGEALYLATINAPRQIVISGANTALDRALADALASGARSATRLAIDVPSHCPLVDATRVLLEDLLAQVEVRAPKIAFAGGLDGRLVRDAAALRRELSFGVAAPVRWSDATRGLYERGARTFVEVAPGDVLTRLATEAFPDARAFAVDIAGVASIATFARS